EAMADESTAQMVDLSLVAEIVRSYVAQNSVDVDQVAGLIATVHRSLSGLGQSAPASAPVPLVPAVPIRRSVQRDHVVCLECGFLSQMLAGISASLMGSNPRSLLCSLTAASYTG